MTYYEQFIEQTNGKIFQLANKGTYISFSIAGKQRCLEISGGDFYKIFSDWLKNNTNFRWDRYEIAGEIRDLNAKALSNKIEEIKIRVGHHEDAFYVNLGNDKYSKITPEVASIVSKSPVYFFDPSRQIALPVPDYVEPEEFRTLLLEILPPLANPNAIGLLQAALVAAIIDNSGHRPIVLVTGDYLSGVTSLLHICKMLLDPCEISKLFLPKNRDEFVVSTRYSHTIIYDDVDKLNPEIEKILIDSRNRESGVCMKTFYETAEESVFSVSRSIFLGARDFTPNERLHHKLIPIETSEIPVSIRLTEGAFLKKFEAVYSKLVGGLHVLSSRCLAILPEVTSRGLPSLGEFSRIAIAVEKVYGEKPGHFIETYTEEIVQMGDRTFSSRDLLQALLIALQNAKDAGQPVLRGSLLFLMGKISEAAKANGLAITDNPTALIKECYRLEYLLKLKGLELVQKRNKKQRVYELREPKGILSEDEEIVSL